MDGKRSMLSELLTDIYCLFICHNIIEAGNISLGIIYYTFTRAWTKIISKLFLELKNQIVNKLNVVDGKSQLFPNFFFYHNVPYLRNLQASRLYCILTQERVFFSLTIINILYVLRTGEVNFPIFVLQFWSYYAKAKPLFDKINFVFLV